MNPTPRRTPGAAGPEALAPVAIVGAGPVGLALALGLARHGVRSVLLEREAGTSEWSKAPAIHVRTREVFRQWGIEERFLDAGTLVRTLALYRGPSTRRPMFTFGFADIEDEADRPGLLVLEQGHTEALLLDAVRETGRCDVRFRSEVVGLDAGADGVRLTYRADGAEHSVEAAFVVGCDGASSSVRRALGLPFEGLTYAVRPMLADVRLDDERDALPWPRLSNGRGGLTFTVRLSPGLWRIVRLERGDPEAGKEVAEGDVGALVREVLGPGGCRVVWASRFRIHRRSSPRFRVGRVLLAGDAAHVHSPAGGQGMNAGIQDAHNLAWKLAHALHGGDVDRLLDSYDVERRTTAAESVSRYTDVVTRAFLRVPPLVRAAAFAALRAALGVPPLRRRILRRATMIDLGYPASPLLAEGERSAGVRLPNVLLRTFHGATVRLYDLLPAGPSILDVDAERGAAPVPCDVIRIGAGGYHDPTGRLRGLLDGGRGWILVRPDAHVAQVGIRWDALDAALRHALAIGPGAPAAERARRR